MILPAQEPLHVLVVDDEKPARQRLIDLIVKDAQVATILEAENGTEAVERIRREQPNLVFLDVQMPQLDGLHVIDEIGPKLMPLTIFVTAYDQHAIRAFDASALDYLLKPFTDERLEAAIERAKARLNERGVLDLGERMLQMVSSMTRTQPKLDRLVVKTGGITRFIRAVDIDWIEAAGVYANLHVRNKEFLYRAALSDLAEKLDPLRFVRVHRSAIVNIESVVQLDALSHGEFEVLLRDGSRTRVSRSYRIHLEQRLGQTL